MVLIAQVCEFAGWVAGRGGKIVDRWMVGA